MEDENEERALKVEAGYAVRWLRRAVGEAAWQTRRVASLEELKELREELDNVLVRRKRNCGGEEEGRSGRLAEEVDLEQERG